ncbi:MAG: FapA family protein [Spirochaetota bacterium]
MDQIQAYMRKQAAEDKQKQFVNVTADTLDEALSQASVELSTPVRRLAYEVLQKGSKGFLGQGKQPFVIMAYPARDEEEAGGVDESLDMDFGFQGDEAEDQDGRALVRLTPDGVMLKVTKPRGDGVRATEQDALDAIRERTAESIDTGNVAKAVKLASGEWVRVADLDYDPANDAMLSVEISDMEMRAYLTAWPPGPGGTDPDYETIVSYLQSNGVVHGFKEETIMRLEEDPTYREPILVAEGNKPVNGKDAEVVYNFETDTHKVKLRETDGRVDFKELNIVQNVVEGQVLAKKKPAQKGEAGRTVTGKLLPATDGADTDILVGKNVSISEDGKSAVADINGQVVIHGGKITVEPVYVVNGDVNLKTGNVLFLGTVMVKGNVTDGFNVKASGNIEVMGNVGKSQLDSEGDIIVHQGVAGKNGGVVRSGGSIWSKFIENVRVESGGLVVVSDGIINSEVYANRKVICRGKRASIVGGKVRAAEEIDAKTLGSVAGMETILEVGYDPRSRERYDELTARVAEQEKEIDEITRNLKTIANLRKQKREISEEKIKSAKEMQRRRQELQSSLEEEKKELQSLDEYLSQLKVAGKVSASGTVYPGVKIYIKDAFLDVRSEFRSVTFISEANAVKVTKYEESEEDITVNRKA